MSLRRSLHGARSADEVGFFGGFFSEGSGCRPCTDIATRAGAGVRKPEEKEPAGSCAAIVQQALWGLRLAVGAYSQSQDC